MKKFRLNQLLIIATIFIAFAIVIYRILCLWQPPMPHYSSPLFHYIGVPQTDILFPAAIAVNIIHQHGSLFNWFLSPSPYLFPDILLSIIIACFSQNIFFIILMYGLIQILYFILVGYLTVRLTTRSRYGGYLAILFLLLALWIVAHPHLINTLGTINIILAPTMHFSITLMTLTLLIILNRIMIKISIGWTMLFAVLFLLTAISDPIMLTYFTAPILAALLINRLPSSMQKNRIAYLALIICLSLLAWVVYQKVPLHIRRFDRASGLHYYYFTSTLSLLLAFITKAPVIAAMWLLFIIWAPISWLMTLCQKNNDCLMIDFVLSLFCLQIIAVLFAMSFMPIIPTVNGHALDTYPMRYLQPTVTLSIFIGLPLLLYKHRRHYRNFIPAKIVFCALLLALALSSLVALPPLNLKKALHPYPPMIACLDQHAKALNLRHGICGYFDYYLINQLNRSGITVINALAGETTIEKNHVNSMIYDEKNQQFDFIVATKTGYAPRKKAKAEWLSPKNVLRIIGPPTSSFICSPYHVYVYKAGQINRVFTRTS